MNTHHKVKICDIFPFLMMLVNWQHDLLWSNVTALAVLFFIFDFILFDEITAQLLHL